MYLNVVLEDKQTLVLSRHPDCRSWLTCLAVFLFGVLLSYNSQEGWHWKSFYIISFMVMALIYLDYWEQCVFAKKGFGTVTLTSQSLMQIIFNLPHARYTVAGLGDIQEITVEHDNITYFGMCHQVVLHFGSGYSLPLTTNGTFGDCSQHYKLAEKVSDFLGIKCEL